MGGRSQSYDKKRSLHYSALKASGTPCQHSEFLYEMPESEHFVIVNWMDHSIERFFFGHKYFNSLPLLIFTQILLTTTVFAINNIKTRKSST